MQDRQVVTCFLVHRGRIALLRRSERVATFQGAWAGVSGTVDRGRTPGEQALAEIREETGRDDARLLVTGPPVAVEAPGYQTRFLVHPFLFHVPSDVLRLDWEHTEARFMRRDEIPGLPTVPGLLEVFDAVGSAGSLAGAVQAICDGIRDDRSRGAGDLAADALDALALCRLADAFHGAGASDWRRVAGRLSTTRPGMEAIRTAVARGAVDAAAAVDAGDAAEAIFAARDRTRSARFVAARAAAAWLEARGVRRVLTLSRSAAVAATIDHLDPAVGVTVLESRPLGEGVGMARELAASGRDVRLMPDAALFTALGTCDAGLIGADGILAGGHVINKVGSGAAAAACRQAGLPLLVVAEGIKASPMDAALDLEEAEWDPGDCGAATPLSPLFERVPADLVDGIATEGGVAAPGDIAAAAESLRRALAGADLWTLFYGTGSP
jgi:ribose 1,5-bisphosphate isomerase